MTPPEFSTSTSETWGERGTAGAVFAGNLAFEKLGYAIDGKQILHDISFSLKPGEIVSVLGPSGCGKTSLLRLAAGVSRPSSGRIIIDGREVAGPAKFVMPEKRNVGLMFQDFVLFPHMSVVDNVAYGLYALNGKDAKAAAMRGLERVGLAKYRDAFPHQLSGGEQQRVALARAIVPRPQVLLMDEPFSGLDQRLRETVRAETLALLHEMRATCMFVTHDPTEALEISDRIMLMRAGRLVQVGTPEQLHHHPVDAEAARFFSDQNEISGVVQGGFASSVLGKFKAPKFKDGALVKIMIRPALVRLARAGEGHEAVVSECRFMGDDVRLSLYVQSLEQPLIAMVHAEHKYSVGQIIHFAVREHGVLVFEK